MAINKPKEEKTSRLPAKEALEKFLEDNGILLNVRNDQTVKIVSDGAMIIGAPQIIISYSDERTN